MAVVSPVAALAALGPQLTPRWATSVVLRQALLDSWLVRQLTSDRAALADAVVCGHQQASW